MSNKVTLRNPGNIQMIPGCNQEKLQSLMRQGRAPLIKTKTQLQQNEAEAQLVSERGHKYGMG